MAATSSVAIERWKFLREALIKNKPSTNVTTKAHSVRRISTFNLFEVQDDYTSSKTTSSKWLLYKHSPLQLTVKVSLIVEDFTLQDMTGFNNTGNVCIWPSEEVMAFYCLENISLFEGKTVCELGAGMTGLAGLMLASSRVPRKIVLTDGNEKSISNLNSIIQANNLSDIVSATILRWGRLSHHDASGDRMEYLDDQFDVLICADCFFFTDVQSDLVILMSRLLKCGGKAVLFAPERSGTFKQFIDKTKQYFSVEVFHNYHDLVDERHLCFTQTNSMYDPNLHYPYCVILTRLL